MKLPALASIRSGRKSPKADFNDHPDEFDRLWRGFMTARVTLGVVLVLLQASLLAIVSTTSTTPLVICATYMVATLAERVVSTPQQLGLRFSAAWLRTLGLDALAFAALQTLQDGSINYTPLFALPVLMASVLGSQLLALASAASVTLLLFAHASWLSLQAPWNASALFSQAALTGAGCFAISLIARELASRLASIELRAQRNQIAAAVQRQVNELIIETLGDGILVVDAQHLVRSANPAAQKQLGVPTGPLNQPLILANAPGWQGLRELVDETFKTQTTQHLEISIQHQAQGTRLVMAHTQLTAQLNPEAQGMCVIFLQDQRELQARLRIEKFASMGRMSAAVAHEIRNPLAAIVQANALLSEELSDPGQQQLSRLVQQNAQRLEKTVHDILHVVQVPNTERLVQAQQLDLTLTLPRICRDWQSHRGAKPDIAVSIPNTQAWVWFDPEHLRRILINLLDNAQRYISPRPDAIQISLDKSWGAGASTSICLRVWSDGAPLDPSVEQHLFEPFFSSESRSSGLGLYICRELCNSHGADINYQRSSRPLGGQMLSGNEFFVTFKTLPAHDVHVCSVQPNE